MNQVGPHLGILRPSASYLIFLCFSFLICDKGRIPISEGQGGSHYFPLYPPDYVQLSSRVTLACKDVRKSPTCCEKPFTTRLCLRFVSPSKLAVSRWQIPLGSEEKRRRMSAGMISLHRIWMKSPTRTSLQHFCT